MQAALKRYRASVLKAACGRLVPQDPSDEPASQLLERILAERRAKWEEEQRAKGKDPAKVWYEEPAPFDVEGTAGVAGRVGLPNLRTLASNAKNAIRRGPFGGLSQKSMFVSHGYKIYEQKNVIRNDFSIGTY